MTDFVSLCHAPARPQLHQPPEYKGEWRCDSPPRSSRDEKLVCIDAPDGKNGRQLHLINIEDLMG